MIKFNVVIRNIISKEVVCNVAENLTKEKAVILQEETETEVNNYHKVEILNEKGLVQA